MGSVRKKKRKKKYNLKALFAKGAKEILVRGGRREKPLPSPFPEPVALTASSEKNLSFCVSRGFTRGVGEKTADLIAIFSKVAQPLLKETTKDLPKEAKKEHIQSLKKKKKKGVKRTVFLSALFRKGLFRRLSKKTFRYFKRARQKGFWRNRKPKFLFFSPRFVLGAGLLIAAIGATEMFTSSLQAHVLSWVGRGVFFEMQEGPNPDMRYPKFGPYNERLGYTYIPFYKKALRAEDFEVVAQMRGSKTYGRLSKIGVYPIYRPKTVTGLTLYDDAGEKVYATAYPKHVFRDFKEIPTLLVNTLLHIENRQLLKNGPLTRNPVIEWGRFFAAAFGQLFRPFMPGFPMGGGSTLGTQIEKFRFSPEGKTGSALEKLKQIMSASLRVYLDGPDTREARQEIILDYLNSTPLSARAGFGEINSIGDGLWAWFGIDLGHLVLALNGDERDSEALVRKASVYRATLGLILSQRRPSYYLQSNRQALNSLINGALKRLWDAKIISTDLYAATRAAELHFLKETPPLPDPNYMEKKAINALRVHLMNLLGLKKLYEVDRLDLSARTTLAREAQKKLVGFLKNMGDKEFLKTNGFYGFRLLKPENDPSKIKWSVVLYERGETNNKIRLQADTIDGPFDMNEGMKLDLGSTAKLRTLVTYLEIIAELHRRHFGLAVNDLKSLLSDASDPLTKWMIHWLINNPQGDLDQALTAGLDRHYSADPREVFFTGGGAHVFRNFDRRDDLKIVSLREALRESVNLVFIRVMRDIVDYTIAQEPVSKADLLRDVAHPMRQKYLERFADQEGRIFLGKYISEYKGMAAEKRLEKFLGRTNKGAVSRTVLFRTLNPDAEFESYVDFMRAHLPGRRFSEAAMRKLYDDYASDRYSMEDRAYLSGVNPMELWLLAYWQKKPKATYRELIRNSRDIRISSYEWLYKSARKNAQDTRIRIILEKDAFARIHKRWTRLGYPFDSLVPSYATSIGSSADRPGALAELVGIILAEGRRLPVERFEALAFAPNTPYQTELRPKKDKLVRQVLSPEVARHIKSVMGDVVRKGTATTARGIYRGEDGEELIVGGKTGTGDQRYDEYSSGGRLLSSRVVNRTGTFVFYIGDRFFGTITAHVAGEEAKHYVFTSALSTKTLAALAPIINPIVNAPRSD